MLPTAVNFSRKVDWNLLKTFHEIAEAGVVRRPGAPAQAARSASRSSALRTGSGHAVPPGPRGFELTDEGMLVAETCRSLNALVRNVPKRLGNLTEEVQGRISIEVISSLVCERFDAAIARFHARHPKVEILIDITTWDLVAPALLRDEIDICVAPAQVLRSDLKYDFLFDEVHKAYWARPSALRQDLRSPRGARGRGLRAHRRRRAGQLDRLPLASWTWRSRRRAFEHLDEAKRLTSLGIGICFLPEAFAAPDVAEGRLWPLLAAAEQPSMPIFVITNPRARTSLRALAPRRDRGAGGGE